MSETDKKNVPKDRSIFLALNPNDFKKAINLTFIQAFLTGMYQLQQTNTLLTEESLKPVLMTSIAALIGYLLKNFFTNSNGELLKIEPPTPISTTTITPVSTPTPISTKTTTTISTPITTITITTS